MQILGKKYPIKKVVGPLKDDDGHEAISLFDAEEGCIKVTDPIEIKVLVHEVVHALTDRLNIQLDPKLEEILAESIALVMTENFDMVPLNSRNLKFIKTS